MFRKYLESNKKTIIFVSNEQQTYVERCLLEIQPAFIHVQVTTIQNYVMSLLKKHHLFEYQLLTQKTSLLVVKYSLDIDHLVYFKNIQLTEGLINALLETYEIMSDVNLSLLPNTGKWQDLKRMYQSFCDYKQKECFMNELLKIAVNYIEKDVCYVDMSDSDYSLSLSRFLKACHCEYIDIKEMNVSKEFYNVQFMHQEMDLVISKISDALKQGLHYQDLIVYVPNSQWVSDFICRCPYPTNYILNTTNNRDLALMDAFYHYDVEKMKSLALIEDDWFEEMEHCSNSRRNKLLEEIVSYTFEDLPEDLDFDTYRLMIHLLCPKEGLEKNTLLDTITVLTYQTPIVTKHFKYCFMMGFNEDVYPSKIAESALILNDELEACYEEGTPLIKNASKEWERVEAILKTADYFHLSCHYSALDGSEALPSLLYNQLKGNQKESKAIFNIPNHIDEISASFDGVVAPLNDPKSVYVRSGISPSELENFNQCPYKHFLSYGLKIRPKRRKMETKAKFGTLMHDMLDECACLFGNDFFEALEKLENKLGIVAVDSLDERLENILMALLNNYVITIENNEEQYLYHQFPKLFLNTLKILLYHVESGEFKMAFHEEKMSYQMNGVTYMGKIDRGDVYKDFVKIIDYKSSNKTVDLALALEGFNIQMVMYLEMLAKNKKMHKGALLYFNTSQRTIEAKGNMALDSTQVEDFEKAYQMEGWISKDSKHEVMYGVDRNFAESQIAHIKYVKSKDDYTGRLLEPHQLDNLVANIFAYLHQLVDRCFVAGDISITPAGSQDLAVQMKVSPCQFCDYQDVCLRDPFYHEPRLVRKIDKEKLEEILGGGEQNGESHIDE